MAAKRTKEATAHTSTTFEEAVVPAVHLRLDRVRCPCGQWVDADDVSRARHLIATYRGKPLCKWASAGIRATAQAFLDQTIGDDLDNPLDEEEEEEIHTPLRPTINTIETAKDPNPQGLSTDTSMFISVLALEDAHLLQTAERTGPQIVRELWEINFLDLPLSARLELRALTGDPGFLYYAVCLAQYCASEA